MDISSAQVPQPNSRPGASLSARESQVLRLIAWGHTNKQIADDLNLSVKTIEAHKANGMRKLGFEARTDIVRHALTNGWLLQGPQADDGAGGSNRLVSVTSVTAGDRPPAQNGERTYPTPCPACSKVEGHPVAVSTVKGASHQLLIRLSCRACDHRWDDTIETQSKWVHAPL